MNLTIVMPARNEASSLDKLLPEVLRHQPEAEIIVVNDGSTDSTVDICHKHGVSVVTHPYSMGNGASINTVMSPFEARAPVFMAAPFPML